MNTFGLVVLITAIAGVVGTGIGGLIGVILNRNSEKVVSLLLSFAGGVMVCIVCFDLLSEAIEQNSGSVGHVFMVAAIVIVGYMAVYLLNFLIDKKTNPQAKHIREAHPDGLSDLIHCKYCQELKKQNGTSKRDLFVAGLVMALAIALHNLPEGMVIGASYAQDGNATGMTGGLAMALVIGLHNIPEGMSVSVPLAAGGMKKPKAVLVTALTGIPTILGAMLGYYLGTLSPIGLSISLAFASGAMLYVVFGELLPESILMWKSKAPALAVLIGIIVGLLILFI